MQMTAGLTFADYASASAVSGWALIKPTTGPIGTGGALFHVVSSATGGLPLMVYASVGGASFELTPNGGAATTASRNAITLDAWNLITFRYNGSLLQVGINEIPGTGGGTSVAYSGVVDLVADPLHIGLETFVFGFQAIEFAGDILNSGMTNYAMTDLEFCKLICHCRDKYALPLVAP